MRTADGYNQQRHGGAAKRRPTEWTDESATVMPPHLSGLPSVGRGSDSTNGEVRVATYRTTKETVPRHHERSFTRPNLLLAELKAKRNSERIIARQLCCNAKETLGLNVKTSDICFKLRSFMCQLRKTEVALRWLNEKLEPFIDVHYFKEECTTNIEFEDEMVDVMSRLYYRLKDEKAGTTEQCKIINTLNRSANFKEFFALTKMCFEPPDVEEDAEEAQLPETSLPSDFLPQANGETTSSPLATLHIQTKDAVLSSSLQEPSEMTGSNIACSSSSVKSSRAPSRKGPEHVNTSDCPEELGLRETILGVNGQGVSRDPETVIAHGVRRGWNRAGHGGRGWRSGNASRVDRRFAKGSGQGRTALNSSFASGVNDSEEFASEFKTVEDGMRVANWIRRLHRNSRRVRKRRALAAPYL